jgi:histidyl-tRNA synthetase
MKKAKELGIQETMEILDGLKLLGVDAAKIAKNGLNWSDLQHLVHIAQEFDTIKDAVQDADQALPELKDISEEEAIIIVAKVFEIVKALKQVL